MGNLLDMYKLIIKTQSGVLNEEKYPVLRFSIVLALPVYLVLLRGFRFICLFYLGNFRFSERKFATF